MAGSEGVTGFTEGVSGMRDDCESASPPAVCSLGGGGVASDATFVRPGVWETGVGSVDD